MAVIRRFAQGSTRGTTPTSPTSTAPSQAGPAALAPKDGTVQSGDGVSAIINFLVACVPKNIFNLAIFTNIRYWVLNTLSNVPFCYEWLLMKRMMCVIFADVKSPPESTVTLCTATSMKRPPSAHRCSRRNRANTAQLIFLLLFNPVSFSEGTCDALIHVKHRRSS